MKERKRERKTDRQRETERERERNSERVINEQVGGIKTLNQRDKKKTRDRFNPFKVQEMLRHLTLQQ